MIRKNALIIKSFIIIFFFVCGFVCNKNDEDQAKQKASTPGKDIQTVEDNDFTETADDLMRVDYKQFYEALAPHGQWVQVKASDIGIDVNKMKSEASENKKFRNSVLDILTGVNNAYATDVNVDFGMFFVWQPAPDLAVSLVATDQQPVEYIPCTNGQWVNSDAGWYFQAPAPYEDITTHY